MDTQPDPEPGSDAFEEYWAQRLQPLTEYQPSPPPNSEGVSSDVDAPSNQHQPVSTTEPPYPPQDDQRQAFSHLTLNPQLAEHFAPYESSSSPELETAGSVLRGQHVGNFGYGLRSQPGEGTRGRPLMRTRAPSVSAGRGQSPLRSRFSSTPALQRRSLAPSSSQPAFSSPAWSSQQASQSLQRAYSGSISTYSGPISTPIVPSTPNITTPVFGPSTLLVPPGPSITTPAFGPFPPPVNPSSNITTPVFGPSPGQDNTGGLSPRSREKQEIYHQKGEVRRRASAERGRKRRATENAVGAPQPATAPQAGGRGRGRSAGRPSATSQLFIMPQGDTRGSQQRSFSMAPPPPPYTPGSLIRGSASLTSSTPSFVTDTSSFISPYAQSNVNRSLTHHHNSLVTSAVPTASTSNEPEQQIVTRYEDYRCPVKLYEIVPENTASYHAQAWLYRETSNGEAPPQLYMHSSRGFIDGGNQFTLVVLHNATNPFDTPDSETRTTTVGVYGYHWWEQDWIHWATFNTSMYQWFQQCERNRLIREVNRWSPDMAAREKRFHKAYWLCANRLPLQNLLARSPVPDLPPASEVVEDPVVQRVRLTNDFGPPSRIDMLQLMDDIGAPDPVVGVDHVVTSYPLEHDM